MQIVGLPQIEHLQTTRLLGPISLLENSSKVKIKNIIPICDAGIPRKRLHPGILRARITIPPINRIKLEKNLNIVFVKDELCLISEASGINLC
ncbi:hypothetical protein ACFLZ1_02385 [Patescibacteria group bacterium]